MRRILLGAIVATVAAGFLLLCMRNSAHEQNTGTDETLCRPENARHYSRSELKRMNLEGKLEDYKKGLSSVLKTPSPNIIIVSCDNPNDVVVRRKFDEKANPPILLSTTLYVPLVAIERYDPN